MESQQTKPFLSIVIPAHNEEFRLQPTVEKIAAFLMTQPYNSEIVVVDNASYDRTYELAINLRKSIANLRVFQESVKGKGQAVKRGILSANGKYRLICDADLAMPVTEIPKFLPPNLPDCDIAIASREGNGAKRFNEPLYRHLVGRVFNLLVQILVLPGLQDTQCGFKCFKDNVINSIFERQIMKGWVFDVELLAIARQLGYSICEVPIQWIYGPRSRVSLLADSYKMLLDLFKIRKNLHSGIYK